MLYSGINAPNAAARLQAASNTTQTSKCLISEPYYYYYYYYCYIYWVLDPRIRVMIHNLDAPSSPNVNFS